MARRDAVAVIKVVCSVLLALRCNASILPDNHYPHPILTTLTISTVFKLLIWDTLYTMYSVPTRWCESAYLVTFTTSVQDHVVGVKTLFERCFSTWLRYRDINVRRALT